MKKDKFVLYLATLFTVIALTTLSIPVYAQSSNTMPGMTDSSMQKDMMSAQNNASSLKAAMVSASSVYNKSKTKQNLASLAQATQAYFDNLNVIYSNSLMLLQDKLTSLNSSQNKSLIKQLSDEVTSLSNIQKTYSSLATLADLNNVLAKYKTEQTTVQSLYYEAMATILVQTNDNEFSNLSQSYNTALDEYKLIDPSISSNVYTSLTNTASALANAKALVDKTDSELTSITLTTSKAIFDNIQNQITDAETKEEAAKTNLLDTYQSILNLNISTTH